jgi:CheY-like chemotaxis protein
MDLGLPDIDGCTVTEMMRELEKEQTSRAVIVALTAHSAATCKDMTMRAGMDAFFCKPFMREDAQSFFAHLPELCF